jgi:CDP-diacylglycerol--inositol 3-phosphatidyltransferase
MLLTRSQNVLFTVCLLNEMFFIALYLISFSSPTPIQEDGKLSSIQSGALTPSIWGSPWSAGAMEMAR